MRKVAPYKQPEVVPIQFCVTSLPQSDISELGLGTSHTPVSDSTPVVLVLRLVEDRGAAIHRTLDHRQTAPGFRA